MAAEGDGGHGRGHPGGLASHRVAAGREEGPQSDVGLLSGACPAQGSPGSGGDGHSPRSNGPGCGAGDTRTAPASHSWAPSSVDPPVPFCHLVAAGALRDRPAQLEDPEIQLAPHPAPTSPPQTNRRVGLVRSNRDTLVLAPHSPLPSPESVTDPRPPSCASPNTHSCSPLALVKHDCAAPFANVMRNPKLTSPVCARGSENAGEVTCNGASPRLASASLQATPRSGPARREAALRSVCPGRGPGWVDGRLLLRSACGFRPSPHPRPWALPLCPCPARWATDPRTLSPEPLGPVRLRSP